MLGAGTSLPWRAQPCRSDGARDRRCLDRVLCPGDDPRRLRVDGVREGDPAACKTQRVPRSLTRSQVEQLAESTRALLDRIRSGELAARPETIHRLEGALVALQAVLGAPDDALRELLEPEE